MILKDFTKYINTLNRYPHNKARKVGFCITNPDGSHDFYEIEKSDIELGFFENTGLNFICLGDFKAPDKDNKDVCNQD